MITSDANPTDPQTLIDAYLDGELASDDVASFERWLAEDAGHRRRFVRQAFLHRQMRDLTAAAALDAVDEVSTAPVAKITPPRSSATVTWRSAASLLIAAAILAVWIIVASPKSTPDPGERQPVKPMAAMLMAADGVEWTRMPDGLPPTGGTGLPIGEPLEFASGTIEIEFYSGVRATIEGPASVRLDSIGSMAMSDGKLSAAVPDGAEGFTVATPYMTVVDRGTEFGVVVGRGEEDEVHVFDGIVDVTAGERTDRVTAGLGRAVVGGGNETKMRTITADAVAFNRPEPIVPPAYRRWIDYRNRLRTDPSLVLYYTFQGQRPDDTVADDQSGRGHFGEISSVAIDDGRIPGKPALRFTGPDSHVRFRIPGEFESLTAIMWVHIDALPHRFNSLMHTDGWEQSEPHWIVGQYGDLYFNIREVNFKQGNERADVDPDSVVGGWRMMTGVFDRHAGTVTFYIDGREVFTNQITANLPLVFDWTEIGNWRRRPGGETRWLNGRIDEFTLLDRAMTADEVAALYEMGRTE